MTNRKPKFRKNKKEDKPKIPWGAILIDTVAIIIGLGLIAGAIAIMVTQHQIWHYDLTKSGQNSAFGGIMFGLVVMILLGLLSSIGIPFAVWLRN